MEIAVLVFDDLTMLDVAGPLEVLARLPDAEVKIVAKDKGPLRAHAVSGGIGLIADHALSDVTSPDILLVPGGFGTRELVGDGTVTGWIGEVHRNTMWTASVCTGALLLGAAGLVADLLGRLGVRLTQVMGGGIILFMISQAAIILEVDRTGVWPWILFGLSANTTTLAYPVLSRHFPLDHAGRANTALNLPVFVGVFVGPHPKPWDAAI